jgi:hypothetical protein
MKILAQIARDMRKMGGKRSNMIRELTNRYGMTLNDDKSHMTTNTAVLIAIVSA